MTDNQKRTALKDESSKRPRMAEKKPYLEQKKKEYKSLVIPELNFKNARDSRHAYDYVLEKFEWPDHEAESDRILANSMKYQGMEIADAFADYYGMKIKRKKATIEPQGSVEPGDIISLKIQSIDKKGTHFQGDSFKEEIVSAVNLYQYARFKENIPSKAIKVKVISVNENKIVVDPIAPLYDEWIKEHTQDLSKQRTIDEDRSVTVRHLKLSKGYSGKGGGYYGSMLIDNVSKFLGEDTYMKCFVPGSQIVLNIENDFEKWEGKEIRTHIISYSPEQIPVGKAGFVCSRKERLKFHGDLLKVQLFKEYTEDSKEWAEITSKDFNGTITGVIHSSNKCGAFIEIPEMNITGFINCKADELVDFKRGDHKTVRIIGFDENTYYNKDIGQVQHANPYTIENGILKSCHLKAIFAQA